MSTIAGADDRGAPIKPATPQPGNPPMNAPRTDSSAGATPTHNSEKHLDSSPADGLSRRVKIVAAVVVLGAIISILDTTIVNVALDTLSRDLHSPLSTIQWVSTGYLLSLAMVIPLAGWLSEHFGSKRVWMVSVAMFAFGSALCGIAWSAESLIFFRVLQGFGGGLIIPVGMSVLAQTAGPRHMGRVMSVIGVPMLLGPVLGPVLGGLIVTNAAWQWIFYVNVPIAALSLILAARNRVLTTSLAGLGRHARSHARACAVVARYSPRRSALRRSSRETVAGERPNRRAIARTDPPAARATAISSRSENDK
jgi:MFS family permease